MFPLELPSHFYSYPLTQVQAALIVEEQAQNQKEISKKMAELNQFLLRTDRNKYSQYLARLQTKIDILQEQNKQNSVIMGTHLELERKRRRERKNESVSDVLQQYKKCTGSSQDTPVSKAYFGGPKRGKPNQDDFWKKSHSMETRREGRPIEDTLWIISSRDSKPNNQMGSFCNEVGRDNPEGTQQLRLPFIKQVNFKRRKRAKLMG